MTIHEKDNFKFFFCSTSQKIYSLGNTDDLNANCLEWVQQTQKRHCAKEHLLQFRRFVARGVCDECPREVKTFEPVLDCGECNWFSCKVCASLAYQEKYIWTRTQRSENLQLNMQLTHREWEVYCSKRHSLKLVTRTGFCRRCGEKVGCEPVLECRICDWFLCKPCSPLPYRKLAEELPSCTANEKEEQMTELDRLLEDETESDQDCNPSRGEATSVENEPCPEEAVGMSTPPQFSFCNH